VHEQLPPAFSSTSYRLTRTPRRFAHEKYKVCMARVTVETSTGDLSNGAAFHIGDGWFVTAAHVLEGNKLVGGAGTPRV
jgi:hypothetical protein